jgi:hypothetical protein
MDKMVPDLEREIGGKNFEDNFFIICKYLNLVKNQA